MSAKSNVTVIIPCYNDGLYIMQALNSVLKQTVKADKIIIVDDGSNQETKKVLEKIDNDEVTIIYQENQGVCKARNNAIQLAKTDYILNLDADDYFEPTFIEKAIDILNHNQEIAVVGCLVKTLTNNRIDTEIKKPLGGVVKDFIVKNNGIASSLFRKQCWEQVSGYDENMKNGYEDWEFWIAILKHNWKMHIIQEPLYTYRMKLYSRDKNAKENFDYDLRKYIFFKHIEVYKEHFEFYATELLRQNSIMKSIKNANNSIEYKIGNRILGFIKLFKINGK